MGVFQFEVPRSEGKRLPGFFRTLEKNLDKIGAKVTLMSKLPHLFTFPSCYDFRDPILPFSMSFYTSGESTLE